MALDERAVDSEMFILPLKGMEKFIDTCELRVLMSGPDDRSAEMRQAFLT